MIEAKIEPGRLAVLHGEFPCPVVGDSSDIDMTVVTAFGGCFHQMDIVLPEMLLKQGSIEDPVEKGRLFDSTAIIDVYVSANTRFCCAAGTFSINDRDSAPQIRKGVPAESSSV